MAPPFEWCSNELFTTFVAVPNESGFTVFGLIEGGATADGLPLEVERAKVDLSLPEGSLRAAGLLSGAAFTFVMVFGNGSRPVTTLLARGVGFMAARAELEVLPKGDLILFQVRMIGSFKSGLSGE